jgi:hypothetical protein
MWMPVRLTVVLVETVGQSPIACWMLATGTVERALMTTLSGSTNERICGSGVGASLVSQLAGAQ